MTEKDLMIQDLQEENRKLKEKITELEKDKWIPADQPPKKDEYILLSFENFTIPVIGRYERDKNNGGAYFSGDDDISCSNYGLFVNAWQPLPEPYKESRR